ncbi:hypothetical protein AGMMS49525_10970 [Bacteroidia bacterium]|nr:hypothetical protein AGMMS49525_10970 [Bacteroidia bacterium]
MYYQISDGLVYILLIDGGKHWEAVGSGNVGPIDPTQIAAKAKKLAFGADSAKLANMNPDANYVLVQDILTSTAGMNALSANMGRVLHGSIQKDSTSLVAFRDSVYTKAQTLAGALSGDVVTLSGTIGSGTIASVLATTGVAAAAYGVTGAQTVGNYSKRAWNSVDSVNVLYAQSSCLDKGMHIASGPEINFVTYAVSFASKPTAPANDMTFWVGPITLGTGRTAYRRTRSGLAALGTVATCCNINSVPARASVSPPQRQAANTLTAILRKRVLHGIANIRKLKTVLLKLFYIQICIYANLYICKFVYIFAA